MTEFIASFLTAKKLSPGKGKKGSLMGEKFQILRSYLLFSCSLRLAANLYQS